MQITCNKEEKHYNSCVICRSTRFTQNLKRWQGVAFSWFWQCTPLQNVRPKIKLYQKLIVKQHSTYSIAFVTGQLGSVCEVAAELTFLLGLVQLVELLLLLLWEEPSWTSIHNLSSRTQPVRGIHQRKNKIFALGFVERSEMLQGLGLHLVSVPPPAVGRVYLGQLPQERPAVDEALLAEHDHGVRWLTGLGTDVCRDLNQMFAIK